MPEEMYDVLSKFAEIRKLDRANLLKDFDLFPDPQNLLTFERKYGDAINYEDINGAPKRLKKKRKRTAETSTDQGTAGTQSVTQQS